jgi:hypothetical protein
MVKAWLDFDPHYDVDSINRERKELERKQRSKAYDVTGWSPAHAYDVDASWCDAQDVAKTAIRALQSHAKGVVGPAKKDDPVYAWIVDGQSDGAVVFAARGMEAGLKVQLSDEPFTAAGRAFARGSLLVRRVENGADVADLVARAADAAGVQAFATGTARSPDDKADLGRPALPAARAPARRPARERADRHGQLRARVAHARRGDRRAGDSRSTRSRSAATDLRRYNVLVVPDGGDVGAVLKEAGEDLASWGARRRGR